MTQDKNTMLAELKKIFTEESQFCSDFASLHAKLFTTDFETLYNELGTKLLDNPNYIAAFNFQYQGIYGTICKTENGRAKLTDQVWFTKPELPEVSLVIFLDEEGFPKSFRYDADGIKW